MRVNKNKKMVLPGVLFIVINSLWISGCVQSTRALADNENKRSKPVYLQRDNSQDFIPAAIQDIEALSKLDLPAAAGFQTYTLKNGLQVNYLPRNKLPAVTLAVIIDGGKYHYARIDETLAPLVLKLLAQGSRKYSRSDFQQQASLLGKPINYWQSGQFSGMTMAILPQDLELAMALLAQQLAHLKADNSAQKSAVQRVIERQLLENKLQASSGAYLARLLFYQNNYPSEHLYYHLQPDSEAIKAVTEVDLVTFYQRHYQPQRTRLIIAGDIEPLRLRTLIKKYFTDWQNVAEEEKFPSLAMASLKKTSDMATETASRFDFIARPGAQQLDLLYGVVTVSRLSPDWLKLKILAVLLGGGPDSRLFVDLREQQGLTYFISARQLAGRYDSPFLIQTSVAHNKLIPAVRGITRHLKELCHNKIPQQALKLLKQQIQGELVLRLQTNAQQVNNKIRQYESRLPDNYLTTLATQIESITAGQLLATANQYLCGKHNFIAVGDRHKLETTTMEQLEDYHFVSHNLPLN